MGSTEWDAINSYFANGVSRLVEHQIESFEDFIRNKLPLIVSSTAPIVVWHEQDENTKKYRYEFRLTFENITYTFEENIVTQGAISFPSLVIKIFKEKPTKVNNDNYAIHA
jgi:hypothetical protein